MKKVLKWLDRNFEEKLLAFLLVMISLIIIYQVIMRYIFEAAQPWPEELARYCLVCSTMLSFGYCIRHNAMLRVDMFVKMLPKPLIGLIEALIHILSMALYVYLLYHSYFVVTMAKNSMQLSPAMQMPMYVLYAFAMLGFGLAVIRTAQNIVGMVIDWLKPSRGKEGFAR